mmetsp:Transcript_33429/g.60566  ORF Transcript_33429/g.60566 Transcript_33429/m.60566 type:complete len:123 (-) Transcript_33429:226-594(-)
MDELWKLLDEDPQMNSGSSAPQVDPLGSSAFPAGPLREDRLEEAGKRPMDCTEAGVLGGASVRSSRVSEVGDSGKATAGGLVTGADEDASVAGRSGAEAVTDEDATEAFATFTATETATAAA